MIDCIITATLLLIMIAGGLWARGIEKREWNNGICKHTGEPWVHFDTDSQGGRGYRSGSCRTWISYRVDK